MWLLALLCIAFYWLLYSFDGGPRPTRPPGRRPPPTAAPFRVDSRVEDPGGGGDRVTINTPYSWWTFALSRQYVWSGGRVVQKDACFGTAEGARVPAVGAALYRYLYDRGAQYRHSARERANLEAGGGGGGLAVPNNYYFECRGGAIERLHACESGEVLRASDCQPVDMCTDAPDGTRFRIPRDRTQYVECESGRPVRKRCRPDTFFFNRKCVKRSRVENVCAGQPDDTVLPLPPAQYVRCSDGRALLERCPRDHVILSTWSRCGPADCVDQPGVKSLRAEPHAEFAGLLYSPGFVACERQRVARRHACPQHWDDSRLQEALGELPMVFDEGLGKCVEPAFCENVWGVDADVVVPVHEFGKRVRNWQFSASFDSVAGFACRPDGVKQRIALPPGKMIVANRFVDCTEGRLPTADGYFDCESGERVACPEGTFFDGRSCATPIPHAHRFKNVPLFSLQNVSEWIELDGGGGGGDDDPPRPLCTGTHVYLEHYNVCADYRCEKYPFLAQIGMEIRLPGGTQKCVFRKGKIQLREVHDDDAAILKYWSQKVIERSSGPQAVVDDCTPGQRLRTGNFVWDSTVFATCNDGQPFVFCPSAYTKGIQKVLDGGELYACVPEVARQGDMDTYPVSAYIRDGRLLNRPTTTQKWKLPKHHVKEHVPDFRP